MNRHPFWLLIAGLHCVQGLGADLPPPGFRPHPPGIHALVGGKVVTEPGRILTNATLLIRDGLIQAVGVNLTPPAEARLWDRIGTTIYAGFIDARLGLPATNALRRRPNEIVTREYRREGPSFYGVKEGLGKIGPEYPVAGVTPEARAVDHWLPDRQRVEDLRNQGFTSGNLAPPPGILRGTGSVVLLSSGALNDLMVKPESFQHVTMDDANGDGVYPDSLMGVVAVLRQALLDAQHHFRRSESPTRVRDIEFSPALDALRPVLLRQLPVLFEPGSALMNDRAARLAREFDLDFLLLASGEEWRRPDLARAAEASFLVPLDLPELPKLPEEDDWESVSLDQLRAWDWAPENPALLRQLGIEIALTSHGLSDLKKFRANLALALDRGLAENDALAALTVVPARLCGVSNLLGTIEPGKLANLTVVEGDSYFDPDNRIREVWIEGRVYPVPPKASPGDRASDSEAAASETPDKKSSGQRSKRKTRLARSPLEGRGPLAAPGELLIRNATIWTCADQGILDRADLLVADGKIRSVGRGLTAAEGAQVLDGTGLHVTPGIVDAHNHSMILGAVNESTLPSTAMVRIGDVVNSESANIHRQLAGGLTTLNLLHGSANPIGGQNVILKLRDGAPPDELRFTSAPAGIKFALGENVKQSNWGDRQTNRFPQTRMGVPAFLANRFTAAREYLDQFAASASTPQPRRDLELEALGEILQGRRWIHCHSYRQDEILAFLGVMDHFGVTVGTLQHVLEGYKVADEIARHGAGASCFSDWWAYKFEVYDAIPYAGSLMRDRGVLVSFNSDSSDLSRRLNLEAAKAVKYGGTPEVEALKFVTINPARQLRIDSQVGSLEPGKDADFAIWSGSPLDSRSVCLQTWIEGRMYFDRDREAARVEALKREREALLERARELAAESPSKNQDSREISKFFHRALEVRFDTLDRHCLEEEH